MSVLDEYELEVRGDGFEKSSLIMVFTKTEERDMVASLQSELMLETHIIKKYHSTDVWNKIKPLIDDSYVCIKEIEVNESHEGQGIGTALMEYFIGEVRNLNVANILLQAFPIHTTDLEVEYRMYLGERLVKFYQNLGFEIVHRDKEVDAPDTVLMSLNLIPPSTSGLQHSSVFE